jgi:6-phosphogluconolactonase
MELKEYPDSEMMMMNLANRIAGDLENVLFQNDRASLAVPGGTTPGPVFDALCGAGRIDWARVNVMLTDERWVPETSPRSNTRLLRDRLLIDKAAAATCLPLSVCLLGMGADMHTASLFPGADQLQAALQGDEVLYAMRAPGAPEPRVTLSARVLKDAMTCHVVITGHEKREALEKARSLSPEEAPIAAVLPGATVHWAES